MSLAPSSLADTLLAPSHPPSITPSLAPHFPAKRPSFLIRFTVTSPTPSSPHTSPPPPPTPPTRGLTPPLSSALCGCGCGSLAQSPSLPPPRFSCSVAVERSGTLRCVKWVGGWSWGSGGSGWRIQVVAVLDYDLKSLPPTPSPPRLSFHDGFTDPLGWEDSAGLKVEQVCGRELLSLVRGSRGEAGPPITLALDSLSFLLAHQRPAAVCRSLQELQRLAGSSGLKLRVLCLLHTDLHTAEVVRAVSHLASSVLELSPLPPTPAPRGLSPFVPTCRAHSIHKRRAGKAIRKVENISVQPGFILQSVPELTGSQTGAESDTSQADPAANLTFRLRLTEEEREARERLSLPFHFTTERKTRLLRGVRGAGQGQIYYQPDSGDDIDDEDPDDDLDV
uniref:Elongator complex protein 5 n=1 Tax=Callorhinchus milii TaxID=7868 RepID=A0A4W3GH33_CALMI